VPKRKPRKPQTPRARTNVRTTVPDEQILGKRRAPVWEKALAYVLAGHSLREASLEYGLPYSTVTTVAGEDRWCEQRGKVDEEVRKRLTEEIVQRRLCAAKAVEFVGDEIAAEHENLIRMVQAEFRIALTELSELRLAGKLATKKGMMGQFRALSGRCAGPPRRWRSSRPLRRRRTRRGARCTGWTTTAAGWASPHSRPSCGACGRAGRSRRPSRWRRERGMVLPLAMSEAEALERALEDPEFHREHIVGKPLFWPQVVVAKAIERAMAAREAETICVRSSRQTMKNEVSGLIEARALVRHQHVGGSIVKTAPTYEPQVTTSKHRLEERTAEDPLVEGKIRWREGNIAQYGNAKVQFLSLDKKARIEGATASLLLEVDEAHLTDEKSFEDKAGPMPGFWAAPKVLWGVAGAKQDMLYRRMSHQLGGPPSAGIIQEKNVFQFPASLWCELNPRWAKTYENTRAYLGRDHPTILTQYELIDVDSLGGYLAAAQQARLAGGDHEVLPGPRAGKSDEDLEYAAVIDIAGEDEVEELDPLEMSDGKRDSTSCWVVEMDWKKAVRDFPLCRLVGAHWWVGKRFARDPISGLPGQQEILAETLRRWNVARYVVDARGLGAQIAAYLVARIPGGLAYEATNVTVSEDCLALLAMFNNDRVKLWQQGGEKGTRTSSRRGPSACARRAGRGSSSPPPG
jgi:hypothetical protein